MKKSTLALCLCALALYGCTSMSDRVLDGNQNQLGLRSVQTRAFETDDQKKVIRAVISTLQDLGFVLDKADEKLGVISGTKLDGYELRMTVAVRPAGVDRVFVRSNVQYNLKPVTDLQPYQQFFASLSKSLFLQALQID